MSSCQSAAGASLPKQAACSPERARRCQHELPLQSNGCLNVSPGQPVLQVTWVTGPEHLLLSLCQRPPAWTT
eukprot:4068720-Amphidinium_carterae.1